MNYCGHNKSQNTVWTALKKRTHPHSSYKNNFFEIRQKFSKELVCDKGRASKEENNSTFFSFFINTSLEPVLMIEVTCHLKSWFFLTPFLQLFTNILFYFICNDYQIILNFEFMYFWGRHLSLYLTRSSWWIVWHNKTRITR